MKNKRNLFVVLGAVAVVLTVGAVSFFGGNGEYKGAFVNFNNIRVLPDNPVTKAEFAVMLVQNLNLPLVPACNTFPDVPVDAWYNQAACTLAENRIIDSAYGFAPQLIVTRSVGASMIYRAYNVSYNCPLPKLFADVNENMWYASRVNPLAALSLFVTDVSIGSNFKPDASLTRGAAQKWFAQAANLR